MIDIVLIISAENILHGTYYEKKYEHKLCVHEPDHQLTEFCLHLVTLVYIQLLCLCKHWLYNTGRALILIHNPCCKPLSVDWSEDKSIVQVDCFQLLPGLLPNGLRLRVSCEKTATTDYRRRVHDICWQEQVRKHMAHITALGSGSGRERKRERV